MKQLSTLFLGLAASLGALQASAAPTLYISNQACFEKPLVYVFGYDDAGKYFDFGYNGLSEGQVTVDGITYDKFSLPDDAVGKSVSIQYSDNWRYNKDAYDVTLEDKDYYFLSNAKGLQEIVEGGVNQYYLLFLHNQTTIDADKNSLKVYAVAEDGTELFGPYPGASYATTRSVDSKDFYLYDMPKGDKSYKFTFSNPDCDFKLESDFIHIPSGHAFVCVTDDGCLSYGNLLQADITSGVLSYTIDKSAKTAVVNGLADPAEPVENLVIPATISEGNVTYRVTAIKDGAFQGLRTITGTLTLGENLVRIGDNAFNGCQNMSGALTIGDNVTYIGNSAFSACIGMNGALTIGNSVETIGDNAFLLCSRLSGALTLPQTLTAIGSSAFSGCSSLDGELTFGDNLATIGKNAFNGCSSLIGGLTFPQSVTSIGDGAFMGCTGFNGPLTLPRGITSLPDNIFFSCSGLTGTLSIPSSVTTIGDAAFLQCDGFTGTLSLPSSVTSIGDNAFLNCTGFNGSLELGSGLTSIGKSAFNGCSKFWGWLTLPTALQTIGDYAFCSCEKFSGPLTIPENVTYIGEVAFGMCEGFKGKLTIGKNVKTIGEQAFVSCSGLNGTLTIPEGVTEIGFRTFAWCWSLTALELPKSLQSLGNLAFYGCWNLTSITCEAETAPSIVSPDKAFDSDNYTKATLYVPAADFMSYKNGYEWCNFERIVAVDGVDAEEIILSNTEISIEVEESVTLTATVKPEDTTDPTLTWTSSDEAVATVENGVVKGVSAGSANITVTCGDITAVCAVTVLPRSGIESVSCDSNSTSEYYNLQGIRIANPEDGLIVIERKEGAMRKVIFNK
ncbi:MAG: leucine-rich repeat protein [Muribaculaceae bacterium]|nr:leucine-rich repeat protein [Muribaculaceae bacterium]